MTNQELAADGIKFDFYLVALTFTVLAFDLQTGHFTGIRLSDALEAASWFLLLISGLVGLWRLEYIPVIYRAKHHLMTAEVVDVDAEKHFPNLERANQIKYRVQRWTFSLGLVALIFARLTGQYLLATDARILRANHVQEYSITGGLRSSRRNLDYRIDGTERH